MKTANDCRLKAANLEQMAAKARDPSARANFKALAATWRAVADAMDEDAMRAERPRYGTRG